MLKTKVIFGILSLSGASVGVGMGFHFLNKPTEQTDDDSKQDETGVQDDVGQQTKQLESSSVTEAEIGDRVSTVVATNTQTKTNTKPIPKKIDTTNITAVDQSVSRILDITKSGFYFPCYTDKNPPTFTGYRADGSSEEQEDDSSQSLDVFVDGELIDYSIYGNTKNPNNSESTNGTGTCNSGYTPIDNFLPYVGSELEKIIKSSKYNLQFFVLEKSGSSGFSENRAILLLPKDTTKLLIDENGKLTFNSVSNPPPETYRLVEKINS